MAKAAAVERTLTDIVTDLKNACDEMIADAMQFATKGTKTAAKRSRVKMQDVKAFMKEWRTASLDAAKK